MMYPEAIYAASSSESISEMLFVGVQKRFSPTPTFTSRSLVVFTYRFLSSFVSDMRQSAFATPLAPATAVSDAILKDLCTVGYLQ
jgi:hypothetical protein